MLSVYIDPRHCYSADRGFPMTKSWIIVHIHWSNALWQCWQRFSNGKKLNNCPYPLIQCTVTVLTEFIKWQKGWTAMSITIQFVQFYGVCWSKKFQIYEVCWSKPQVADSCILIHKNEDQHTFSIYKIHESAIFSSGEIRTWTVGRWGTPIDTVTRRAEGSRWTLGQSGWSLFCQLQTRATSWFA